MKSASVYYYKLKMLDGTYHICRRIELPSMIVDDLFSIIDEEQAQKLVDELNSKSNIELSVENLENENRLRIRL